MGRCGACRPTEAWEVFQASRVSRTAFEEAGPVVLSSPDLVRGTVPALTDTARTLFCDRA